MSYRVDIPTLSANEVYTLTFEYEGTETIQLIVGDLTLETTDRRVVFTTTSPVNYIESNVNLTNLNMYEGYYESDDFGGEYTQESYIEGKSLINLMPASEPKTLSQGWSLDFDETTGVATIVFNNNTNNFSCSMRSFNMMKRLKPATYYTYFVEILENSLVNDSGNKPNVTFYNVSGYMYPSTQCPYNPETIKGDCVGKTGEERCIIKNEASPGKYVWVIKTVDTFVDTMVDADKIFQAAALNGTIKVRMMIVEGDYVDNPIETNWFPQGIGCVKSPKILSQTKEPNLAETELFQMSTSSSAGSSYDKETQTISITNTARATSVGFYFQPQKWGYGDYENFCVEFDVIYIEKLKDGEQPYFSLVQHATPRGDTKANTPLYEGKHYTLYFESSALLDTKSTLLRLAVNGGTGGINKTVTITNFKLYHVNNINGDNGASEVGTYDCCEVSTPDDLELHGEYDAYGNWYGDKLDLTTGTFYQYYDMWDLATLLSQNGPLTGFGYNSDTNTVYVHYDIGSTHPSGTVWGGAGGWSALIGNYFEYGYGQSSYEKKTSPYVGFFNKYLYIGGMSYDEIFNGVTINGTSLNQNEAVSALIQFASNNKLKIGLPLNTPTIKQLSLNPLKSYRNGSITTSSQQLAPTLKTTLPVSNKFTTTNLSSGQTYNIYFDGTATKLDAGGTIITNPISPCEVECGGTTLTIEGTDIQNVRVLETTNKNEVGNNSTSDVELTKIETSDMNGENIITSDLEQPIKLRSLGTTYDSYNPVTGELTKRIGVSETDGSYSVLSSPVVSQVEIDNIPHLYTDGQVKVYSESDVYPTTILNGQSTNNYEVNGLNRYNNYTIRYNGTCESINLANKSNEQGTNRIVKSGTDGRGNLTFVNNSEDIDNVLLVEHDVREQEINHFNGLQTVEVNQLFISNKQNLFESYIKNDFDIDRTASWIHHYSSLHNRVFKCGCRDYGSNLQLGWCLAKPESGTFYHSGVSANALEDKPIMLGGKEYHISCNIVINDDTTSRTYTIAFYGENGAIMSRTNTNSLRLVTGTSSHTTKQINTLTIPSTDVYAIALWADNGGAWMFDCTITDFTICEPENAKPDVPLVYEYIDLPQPVQLNSLPDGTHDTYNPITGEYVQRVNGKPYSGDEKWNRGYTDLNCISYFLSLDRNRPDFDTSSYCTELKLLKNTSVDEEGYFVAMGANYEPILIIRLKPETLSGISFKNWLQQSGLVIFHEIKPITTQLTPIEIPTFEGGILQLITTDGKVFPMVEYSMPTNNRYDTSSWEAGAVYTQRNMTEAYFNDSTTPMTPTETMTLTTDHISSGSIILNDNGNGLIVLKGNYTGRDIPYFTGMRSVEAIEVETTPSPDQPLFGKGGRR